jgi:winged helix DNA-binding protein
VQRIDVDERRARLVLRHRLAPRARASSALDATRAVVVLHSSDAVTVFLSVHARTSGLTQSDVEDELYEKRTLVRMLGMRRTLFVVPRELVPVVEAGATRAIAARERKRLEQMILVSEISKQPAAWLTRALSTARREVEARGEAFTSDLTKTVPALGKRLRLGTGRWEVTQSAGSRILPQLAMELRVVRGRPRTTWANGQYRWVPTAAWLGAEIERMETADAQATLLQHWLAAFGPATEVDMRWWTGWTARETRAALAAFPHVEVDLDGARGYVLADDLEATEPPEPSAALLPTLDPTTMGWKERAFYLGDHERTLFDSVGNAGPTVWWEGRVVGGWSQRENGEIAFRLLEDVGREAISAIEAEAGRVSDWIGDTRFSPTFLPPFQRELGKS